MFLDDQLYEKMIHPRVTYVHLKPYHHKYDDKYMIHRYLKMQIYHMKILCY